LREDRRHIQDRDVWALREKIGTRLNLEMANVPSIVEIALRLKPDIVCLVPSVGRN
jgi:pyridoxine 5-phosphate synthase